MSDKSDEEIKKMSLNEIKDDSEEIVDIHLKIPKKDSRWMYMIILAGQDTPGNDEHAVFHREWATRMRKAFWDGVLPNKYEETK